MKETFIFVRNCVNYSLYRFIFRPIFFLQDPQRVHDKMIVFGKFLGSNILTRTKINLFYGYSNPKLTQDILGITFNNPIGLAAGFDKDAKLLKIIPHVGFGFEEIGSVTAKPYIGNHGLRLMRLKKSKALLVNYGLKNDGADVIYLRLKGQKINFPVGINIAKTNSKETVEINKGIDDYLYTYKKFSDIGDYVTINISCPNAYGGEDFTNPDYLEKLLKEILKIKKTKPVFLKISPELDKTNVDKIIKVSKKYDIDGFVISNLIKDRTNKKLFEKNIPKFGGISGIPCRDLSDKMIEYIYTKTKGKFIIIGCGGIFSAKDAYRKIKLGANLVQLITGMIYEGPQLISEINQDLVKLMEKDGFENISQAVGNAVKN